MANVIVQHYFAELVQEEKCTTRTDEPKRIIERLLTSHLKEEIEHVLLAEKEVLPQVWIRYL